jgi:hypothetical protein
MPSTSRGVPLLPLLSLSLSLAKKVHCKRSLKWTSTTSHTIYALPIIRVTVKRIKRNTIRKTKEFTHQNFCQYLGVFVKPRKAITSYVMSVCLSVRVPIEGFSWNFLYEYFSNVCRDNLSVIKIWQKWRVLYIKTQVHVAKFSLEGEFIWKWQRKSKHAFYVQYFFPRKSSRLWENVEKCGTATPATDNNIIRRMRCACWIPQATRAHTMNTYHLLVFHGKNGYANAPQR